MEEIVLAIVGVVGSLGIVQVVLSRDAESITKCRLLCFDLKRLLEDFADRMTIPQRNAQDDPLKIKEIKGVIEQLYVEKEGLLLPSYLLNELLDESLPLFDRLRTRDGNQANQPHFVGADLVGLWGLELVRPFKMTHLLEIQKFLHRKSFKRFFSWGGAFIKRIRVKLKGAVKGWACGPAIRIGS